MCSEEEEVVTNTYEALSYMLLMNHPVPPALKVVLLSNPTLKMGN
jgi:hypothetical protein